jgi:hypothetical protein
VKSAEFSVAVTADNGAFVNVKLRTKHLYDRIGIKRVIPDVKSTLNTIRLLQKPELQQDRPSPSDDAVAGTQLSTLVAEELNKLARYGSTLFVTAKHPDTGEQADYRVKVSTYQDTMISFNFKSIDLDRNTGTVKYSYKQVAAVVAKLLGVDESDTDFISAIQTSHKKSVCDYGIRVRVVAGNNEISLAVRVPTDSFTGDSDVFAEVGFVYFS